MAEKPVALLKTPPPPLPLLPPPPASGIQRSHNQPGIMCKVQGGLTRLKEKCQSTWKSLTAETDVGMERREIEELLLQMEEREPAMEGVQLRPRSVALNKEWARRLTDYQFLAGKDEKLPKRQTRSTIRVRRNHRASLLVPQNTKSNALLVQQITRPNDPGYRCSKCEMVVHRNCLYRVQRCERPVIASPTLDHHPPITNNSSDPYPGYGTLELLKYPWWVEKMTREEATRRLKHLQDGTFLIRWSDRHQKLVLSLKVAHDVKHMRVLRHEETSSYYLSEVHYFHNVEALVLYYKQNFLSECFSELFSLLSHPLYDTAVAKFSYQGSGANYLSLEPGDKVIILSHDGESTGWWKGRIDNRVGYFPKEFVHVKDNMDSM